MDYTDFRVAVVAAIFRRKRTFESTDHSRYSRRSAEQLAIARRKSAGGAFRSCSIRS